MAELQLLAECLRDERLTSGVAVASAALLIYDWSLTSKDELKFMWRFDRITYVRTLFFFARYAGLACAILDVLPMTVSRANIVTCLRLVTVLAAEFVLATRTWAAWERSRTILTVLCIITCTPPMRKSRDVTSCHRARAPSALERDDSSRSFCARTFDMAPHISLAVRELIVLWRNEGKTARESAALAHCSIRSVYNILELYDKFGVVKKTLLRARGRPRLLTTNDINYISSLLSANPTLFLDELQSRLLEYRQVDVSLATLSRTLRNITLTNKSVAKTAAQRDELLRATWQAEYGDIPAQYFVWLDESSVDNRTNQRNRGWAPAGHACVRRETFLRGVRYSVLPALTYEGFIALDIFEGAVTKAKFVTFLEQDLAPLLNPYPGPRSVVVMDNCTIHHDEEVRRIVVDECGAKLVYLPPYSPDLNPIEQAFHSVKAWLRRHEAEAVRPEVRPWLIEQAAASVSQESAEGWILNSGYEFA